MDLLHNVVADMDGPTFLLFYAIAIGIVYLMCRIVLRLCDQTAAFSPPLVPSRPDPYEIAYLRGGDREVARTAVFNLIQQGYLQVIPGAKKRAPERIARHTGSPKTAPLPALERAVLDQFANPRTAQEVFQSLLIPPKIKLYCASYEQRLAGEQLLSSAELKKSSWQLWLASFTIPRFPLPVNLSRSSHAISRRCATTLPSR